MTESSKEGLLEELLEIQRTHQQLEAAARGYIELDLTMEQRNEIVDRMIEEEVGEIPDLLARVKSNSDLGSYWTGHVLCFFGYVLGRAGENDQAAIHLQEAVEIFSDYEKSHPYPDGFPLEEIEKYGADNSYFSQHAHGFWIAMLPEDEKEQAHIENIERVKSNFPDNKYWISEVYRKAGEYFIFSEGSIFSETAIDYFRQGLGYIESLSDIDDLKNNEEDGRFGTWLKLKVEYIENLDMYKKTDEESEEVLKGRKEIEPYKHLITWRQEFNRGDFDTDPDKDVDNVMPTETINYSDGSIYIGEVIDGSPNGQGARTHPDGTGYIGEFRDNYYHGHGTLSWPDGSVYEGDWEDGKSNGQGAYSRPNGEKYIGEWKDDEPHGTGVYTWANGDRYEGEFHHYERHGQAVLFPGGEFKGDKFVGEFRNDEMYKGTYTRGSGEFEEDVFEGTFVGSQWADGEYTFKDGRKFIGRMRWRPNSGLYDGILYHKDGSEERIKPKLGFVKRLWKKD
jgi:hypothetical protein